MHKKLQILIWNIYYVKNQQNTYHLLISVKKRRITTASKPQRSPQSYVIKNDYAILINGGNKIADNFLAHWNNLSMMYKLLVETGHWMKQAWRHYAKAVKLGKLPKIF
jgi:hypothetical protein